MTNEQLTLQFKDIFNHLTQEDFIDLYYDIQKQVMLHENLSMSDYLTIVYYSKDKTLKEKCKKVIEQVGTYLKQFSYTLHNGQQLEFVSMNVIKDSSLHRYYLMVKLTNGKRNMNYAVNEILNVINDTCDGLYDFSSKWLQEKMTIKRRDI